MYATTRILRNPPHFHPGVLSSGAANDNILMCDWPSLEEQLLMQWHRLTKKELDAAGPYRHEIAELVQRKYGISTALVENYLANLARTLPMQGVIRAS